MATGTESEALQLSLRLEAAALPSLVRHATDAQAEAASAHSLHRCCELECATLQNHLRHGTAEIQELGQSLANAEAQADWAEEMCHSAAEATAARVEAQECQALRLLLRQSTEEIQGQELSMACVQDRAALAEQQCELLHREQQHAQRL